MTINLPIETYKRLLKAAECLRVIVANAEISPGARMGGHADIYTVPLDDIEDGRKIIAEL